MYPGYRLSVIAAVLRSIVFFKKKKQNTKTNRKRATEKEVLW